MKAKKHLLDKAKQDGAAQRINELISVSYMLISEALVLQSEADDTLRKYGLVYAEIKHRANALQKEFDKYFACIKSMITEDTQKEASKENAILPTSISNCIHGRSKSAGGFIWKLK